MPEDASLAETKELTQRISAHLLDRLPGVKSAQAYIGNAGPLDLNDVNRRGDLRRSPQQAEICIRLLERAHRAPNSHEIAAMARKLVQDETENVGIYVKATKARVVVLADRAGPPSDHTALVEIYGSDEARRRQLANDMIRFFERAKGITPLEDSLTASEDYLLFSVDPNKIIASNVPLEAIDRTIEMALGSHRVGDILREPREHSIPVILKAHRDSGELNELQNLIVPSATGAHMVKKLIRIEILTP